MRHPWKVWIYLLTKLPAAFFSGVRLQYISGEHCIVRVPFKWFSQNPFRSTYFACLAMGAEMSTGLLALMYIYNIDPAISMLVTKVEGEFYKKAVGLTTFVCNEGQLVSEAVANCILTQKPSLLRIASNGTNPKGELIATFYVTWSFRQRPA